MRVFLTALALLLAGCAVPTAVPAAAPVLARAEAERLVLRADDLLRAALEGQGADPLAGVFRGQALTALRLQVARLTERGLRLEERNFTRRLVHYDPAAAEAVLAVTAEHRLSIEDSSDTPWAATERQWWARFSHEAGAWWIVEQQNLPPDRWIRQ